MKKRIPFALLVFFAVGLGLALAGACSAEEAGQPFVRLYDTGTQSSDPLPVEAVAAKAGWVQVPVGDTARAFKGNVAFGNDRLTVVIPTKGGSALVYTPAGGAKRRSALMPILRAGGAAEPANVFRIIENTSGAVAVEVTFAGPATATFRLVVGQPYVEVRPGAGMAALSVDARPRLIVVPDFFGDDMVFRKVPRPAAFWHFPFLLPSENFILGLGGSGDSITMCVWQDRRIGARTEMWKDDGPSFAGWEIDCIEGKSIWVAFLEGEGLWQERSVPWTDSGKALDWKPPFPAKWRADRIGGYLFAESVTFESPPVLKPDQYFIYPLDRTRATPLTEFTPVDILRNTLGVGPCQYILETEGLASADNPTPDNVLTWVEKQFKKKGGKDAADDIRERLKAMVELAGRTEARIKRYADFAAEMKQSFAANPPVDGGELKPIAEDIEKAAADGLAATQPPGRVAKLAETVAGLIGKDTAAADLAAPAAELRAIGAAQDRALAKSRMAVRWLGCRALNPEIRKRTEAFLQGK